MAKLTTSDLANLQDETAAVTTINANFAAVETALENTLSRDGTSPNTMSANLDMNSHRIVNLPEPTNGADAATKNYVDDIAGIATVSGLADALIEAEGFRDEAEAFRNEAEVFAEALTATSTTTLTPSVASKTFTTQASKAFIVGGYVFAVSDSSSAIWMHGQVTSYSGTSLQVNVTAIGTATEKSDWTIQVSGPRGATGTAGGEGNDYTADDELNALSQLTATPGLLVQTADNTFTTREVAGTTDRIEVTNPAGVAGNITLDVGDDVVVRDVTTTLSVGYTHTTYDHGSKSGTAAITPLPSLGALQKVSLAASCAFTVNAPTAEEGACILQITNTGAPTSITLSSFDKTFTGDTISLTINKVHWLYITSIGTIQTVLVKTVV